MLESAQPQPLNRAIHCPKCGASGQAVWENEPLGLTLVSLSSGFYERLARFTPYRIDIVCHACGTALPEHTPR